MITLKATMGQKNENDPDVIYSENDFNNQNGDVECARANNGKYVFTTSGEPFAEGTLCFISNSDDVQTTDLPPIVMITWVDSTHIEVTTYLIDNGQKVLTDGLLNNASILIFSPEP